MVCRAVARFVEMAGRGDFFNLKVKCFFSTLLEIFHLKVELVERQVIFKCF